MIEIVVTSIAALAVAAFVTGLMRRVALAHGVLDVPNSRSSHAVPTPRGGGVSIVLATSVGVLALAALGVLSTGVSFALGGGGIAVAIVGFLDDRYHLSALVRLCVHFGAVIWALVWLGSLPALPMGDYVIPMGLIGQVAIAIWAVWMLNLFNFMDGIDGIAASEAMFVSWGSVLLTWSDADLHDVSAIALIFGAACGGFLLWNWPPAKIFMGDVGSGYCGYTIAILALAAMHHRPAAIWVWVILGGVFFVDATITLVRRAIRGDRVYEAHRSHAYQWLARRWGSHRRVTLGVMMLNVCWLLPAAAVAVRFPEDGLWVALVALLPLAALAVFTGSGKAER